MTKSKFCFAAIMVIANGALSTPAADWPQWGRDSTRNAVSPEKDAPVDFVMPTTDRGKVVDPGRNIAWQAELGTRTVVAPVIADGLVWACANAKPPDDDKIPAKEWDGGVLLCFRETDGKLLWKLRTPRLSGKGIGWGEDHYHAALGSVPLIEGDRLWYVNNRSDVVCFDIGPLKKNAGEPREIWKLDMRQQLKVYTHLPLMQSGLAASVAGYKDWLFVVTHNGVDEGQNPNKLPSPDAPSLICLEKISGKLIWKDNSPGKSILHCQISSPLVAEVGGRVQVIVGQGDGWLRSFDSATGKLFWKCDLNSKESIYDLGGGSDRNYVVATPVLYDGRVYISTGREASHGSGSGRLHCIDPTKNGDISLELDDGPKKGKPNPNSAVVWHTPNEVPSDAPRIEIGKKKRDLLRSREYYFGRCMASVTAQDGLLYALEFEGYLHCFDAKTGKLYWAEDLKSYAWAQPLWVDGKVYVATEDGDIFVFAHGKQKQLLAKIETASPIRAALVFANRTLYVTGESQLYAIRRLK